jgi:hypothetical protein
MLILLALLTDFLAASLCSSWIIHTVLAYLLVRVSLPAERTPWAIITLASAAFMLADFAAHGIAGMGLVYLVPTVLILLRLKTMLVHGAAWLVFIGFLGFFFYEALVCGGNVTIAKISFNLAIGYLTLLGLRGNRGSRPRAGGLRKVWTPSRKDAS